MEIYHNSQDIEYRKPFGAVKAGERVLLAADVNDSKFCGCSLRLWTDSEGEKIVPMSGRKSGNLCRYSAEITAPEQAGLVWYCFIVDRRDGGCCWYGNNSENLGGVGEIYDTQPPSFQITVYDYAPVPDWYKNAIVYQIFPDRFNRSPDWLELQQRAMAKNSMAPSKRVIQTQWSDKPYYTKNSKGEVTHWPFFGGTLSGIREKILYLKSIGVTAVYLNPIFEAHSNHRYDTADYMHIDPALGTDDDFKALAEACRDAGIRIILDGVFSHTGVDSRYFDLYGTYGGKGAASGKQSEYYDWYNFKHFPDDYDCWWGVKDLPNVNEMTPSYQSFIYGDKDSVIRHWLKMGADGWRLDVADELPDEFISGIRRAIKEEKTDGLLIGEVWEDASNKISYGIHRRYLLGNELDGTMH